MVCLPSGMFCRPVRGHGCLWGLTMRPSSGPPPQRAVYRKCLARVTLTEWQPGDHSCLRLLPPRGRNPPAAQEVRPGPACGRSAPSVGSTPSPAPAGCGQALHTQGPTSSLPEPGRWAQATPAHGRRGKGGLSRMPLRLSAPPPGAPAPWRRPEAASGRRAWSAQIRGKKRQDG